MDIMTQIREGMHVIEADGKDVGKVRDFAAGDPDAVTIQGEGRPRDDGTLVGSAGVLSDANVPREEAERLAHSGWLRVHKGLLTRDHFLPADELDRVEGDRVWLRPGVHLK